MGEGTLAEVRGESEKRVNVSEFISVEPKLGAERGVHNERKLSTSLLLKIDRAGRSIRVHECQKIRQRDECRERITRPVHYSPAHDSSRLGF